MASAQPLSLQVLLEGAGEEDEKTQVLCVSIGQWLLCGCLLHPWIPQISLLLCTTVLGSWDTSSVWWQWADPSCDLQCSTMSWALECPYPRALLQWRCQDHLHLSLWGGGVEEYAGHAFPGRVFPGRWVLWVTGLVVSVTFHLRVTF